MGVTLSCGDTGICPNAPVTRAEVTALLVQATGADLVNPARRSFQDVYPSHWAYHYIETAHALGWYSELWPTDEDGFLGPNRYLERRELARLLFNIDLSDAPTSPGGP